MFWVEFCKSTFSKPTWAEQIWIIRCSLGSWCWSLRVRCGMRGAAQVCMRKIRHKNVTSDPPLLLVHHYPKTESCEARKALYCKNTQISPTSLRHSSFTYSFFTVDRGACLVPARLWKHRGGSLHPPLVCQHDWQCHGPFCPWTNGPTWLFLLLCPRRTIWTRIVN